MNRARRRNGNYVQHQSREENISHSKNFSFVLNLILKLSHFITLDNRYDDMERIREKQQKAYEEQALRYAQEKKTVKTILIFFVSEMIFCAN